MCGCHLHGFWWLKKDKESYEVVFANEVNSHEKIRDGYPLGIPENAFRLGVRPTIGKIVTNAGIKIPEEVIEKTKVFFEAYYPNKECIAEWIKNNYAKNNDKMEWDRDLVEMLDNEGVGLFHKNYYKKFMEDYLVWQTFFQGRIKVLKATKIDGEAVKKGRMFFDTAVALQLESNLKSLENCNKMLAILKGRVSRAKGMLEVMNINKFIKYFLEHPNEYWSERQWERQIEYKQFVTADNL